MATVSAGPPAPAASQHVSRAVVHLDADAFYCQVEQQRLGIPPDMPCAVQQWQGLIAVNYPARAAGVTRHMRVHEAKRLCPTLQLVHVATVGNMQQQPSGAPAGAGSPAAAAGVPGSGSALDRGNSKASLQRYRKASAQVMRLLAEQCPGCLLEKASIDEAYIDVTPLALRELRAASAAGGISALLARAAASSVVLGDGGLEEDRQCDRLLAAGAVVAARVRGALFDQLGYTASAGIASNKLCSKIASAANKPNQQTVVLPRAVEGLMQGLPLGKVKGLGGKLGRQLEDELGAPTAGAVAGLPWQQLVSKLGGRAAWVFQTVRGIDNEPVTPKDKVKSINAAKSFPAVRDLATVGKWLAVLAEELAERVAEDEDEHCRRARALVLSYRTGSDQGGAEHSLRSAMPRDAHSAEAIAAAGLALFHQACAPCPVNRLALAATDFVDQPGAGGGALARFLLQPAQQGAGPVEQQQQQQQQPQQRQQQQQPQQRQQRPASSRGGQQQLLLPPLQQQEQQRGPTGSQQPGAGPDAPASSPQPAAAEAASGDASGEAAGRGAGGGSESLLSSVNVAEQRRLLRDIEIRGLLQRSRAAGQQQQQQPAAAAAAGAKRQASGQQGQRQRSKGDGGGSGKQMRLDALFQQGPR